MWYRESEGNSASKPVDHLRRDSIRGFLSPIPLPPALRAAWVVSPKRSYIAREASVVYGQAELPRQYLWGTTC